MNKNKNRIVVGSLVSAGLLILIDQIIKIWALNNLKEVGTIKLLPGFLNLTFVPNSGAAFGLFKNYTVILSVISGIALLVIIAVIVRGVIEETPLIVSLSLILAGGIGNLIDRIRLGFVVDYLDLDIGFLKDFPVFNFADCCVVVGAILFLLFVLIPSFKTNHKEAIS